MVVFILFFGFFLILLVNFIPNLKSKIEKYSWNMILFSSFNVALLYFLFRETEFGLYGLSPDLDVWFRTAYINKISSLGKLGDFAYKNKSMFYSPFYCLILGICSNIFNIESYKMIKYGFLLVYWLTPILAYHSWIKIIKPSSSFIVSTSFFVFIADFNGIYQIEKRISLLFLIPYILIFYGNYHDIQLQGKGLIKAGFFGSILFCTYFSLFFVLIPLFIIDFLIKPKVFLKKKVLNIIKIGTIIALFSSYFIFPLFFDLVRYGMENHQNFNISDAYINPLNFIQNTHISLLSFVGFTVLLSNCKSELINELRKLFFATLSIILIGYFAFLFDFPIFHRQFYPMLSYILIIAAIIYLLEIFPNGLKALIFRINNQTKKLDYKNKTKHIQKSIVNTCVIFCFLLVGTQNISNGIDFSTSPGFEDSINQEIPENEIAIFSILDFENKVFLTNNLQAVPYLPIYLYSINAHFSHPSSLLNQRNEYLLNNLSNSKNGIDFYKNILLNPYDVIDFFYLNEYNDTHLYYSAKFEYGFTYYAQNIFFKKTWFENQTLFQTLVINGKTIYKTNIEEISFNNNFGLLIDGNEKMELIFKDSNTTGLIDNPHIIDMQILEKKKSNLHVKIQNTTKFIKITNLSLKNVGLFDEESAGIKIVNSSNIIIENVSIRNCVNGILIDSSNNISLFNSRFDENKLNGIFLENSVQIKISNSTFNNNLFSSIKMISSNDIEVENNCIRNTKYDVISRKGIIAINCIFTANNNYIDMKKGIGMLLKETMMSIISNNEITRCIIGMILDNGEKNSIFLNNFTQNQKLGIQISGNYNLIDRNNFRNNDHCGIFLKDGNFNIINRNALENSLQYGIIFYSSSNNEVKQNIFKNMLIKNIFIDKYSLFNKF